MPRLSFAQTLKIDGKTTNVREAALVVLRAKSAVPVGPVVVRP